MAGTSDFIKEGVTKVLNVGGKEVTLHRLNVGAVFAVQKRYKECALETGIADSIQSAAALLYHCLKGRWKSEQETLDDISQWDPQDFGTVIAEATVFSGLVDKTSNAAIKRLQKKVELKLG